MKFTLFDKFRLLLVVFILVGFALSRSRSQTVITARTANVTTYPIVEGEHAALIKGKIAGEIKQWLAIEAHNGPDWSSDGYDPNYTRIVCDYKPIVRKLPGGFWEIQFTSEIAEQLP